MTLNDAAKVLSEHEHRGCLDWYVVRTSDEDIVCGVNVEDYLPAFEAVAIAHEYLRLVDVAEGSSLADEVASVLAQLDELAETWGDEAVFRRCRDRLRAAVKGGGDV